METTRFNFNRHNFDNENFSHIIVQIFSQSDNFPTKKTIDEIQTCMYEFLWNSKTHKVKKNVVIQDYENGGLKMKDFETIIRVEQLTRIKHYLNNIEGSWRNTMEKVSMNLT